MSYPQTIADLPDSLPVFPLQGALLLPRARLPLNIFEPRYMAMVDDALAASRAIGMIQPKVPEQTVPSDHPDLHELGCAGRITSFEETADGRYLISLTGLCRFGIREELALRNGYRRVVADYAPWSADFDREDPEAVNREQLTGALKNYLSARQLGADWDAIDRTPTVDLISIVAMTCPFSAMEKQALLRTRALTDRAELIISMLLINSAGTAGTETVN